MAFNLSIKLAGPAARCTVYDADGAIMASSERLGLPDQVEVAYCRILKADASPPAWILVVSTGKISFDDVVTLLCEAATGVARAALDEEPDEEETP